jgi:hypothetical protein
VREQRRVQREARVFEPLQPRSAGGQSGDDRCHDGVGQVVEQRALAAEVPVQRGRLDAQLGGQPPHGQLVQALVGQQLQRDAHGVGNLQRHVPP